MKIKLTLSVLIVTLSISSLMLGSKQATAQKETRETVKIDGEQWTLTHLSTNDQEHFSLNNTTRETWNCNAGYFKDIHKIILTSSHMVNIFLENYDAYKFLFEKVKQNAKQHGLPRLLALCGSHGDEKKIMGVYKILGFSVEEDTSKPGWFNCTYDLEPDKKGK